jgi:hypothetical protein
MTHSPEPGQQNPLPERSGTLIEPGANFSAPQPGRPQPVERSGTLIETDDDIRQAFLSGYQGRQRGQPIAVDPPCSDPAGAAACRSFGKPVPPNGAAAGGCTEYVRVSHTHSECGTAVLIAVVAGSR